jgi:sodium/potassium-transporting ATPase subunit alpha
VFKLAPFNNQLLLIGIAVEIGSIVLIDYTPVGNVIFGTAPIPAAAWLLMIPCAAAMLFLEEIRKWLVRRRIIYRKHGLAVPGRQDQALPAPLR